MTVPDSSWGRTRVDVERELEEMTRRAEQAEQREAALREKVGAQMSGLYMVFDVESIGLHGEGFAVGYVVVTRDGEQVGERIFACHPDRANGGPEGRAWVAENCPPIVFNCASPREVRRFFWAGWQSWKEQGAVLVADCAWPVEARFLAACVDDHPDQNAWNGPYPLHELASFMVAAGLDPMANYDRLPDEPQHDPLGDAKQSARLLLLTLAASGGAAPAEQADMCLSICSAHQVRDPGCRLCHTVAVFEQPPAGQEVRA